MYKAYQEAQKLRSLASIYTLLDNTNTYYIAHKDGFIEAYGDAVEGDRTSAIEMKRRFDYPEELQGQAAMGLNMSYDGWIITVTDTGKLLALKPDFSEHYTGNLLHNEGAENKATKPAGYGWVRNAPSMDDEGNLYVASQGVYAQG